ncbi:hypothetical protein TrVE_jg1920 [Triparma verrucosa]|nr:hypothetical protein TrVE_jg1920 [Triparma verrucosa]
MASTSSTGKRGHLKCLNAEGLLAKKMLGDAVDVTLDEIWTDAAKKVEGKTSATLSCHCSAQYVYFPNKDGKEMEVFLEDFAELFVEYGELLEWCFLNCCNGSNLAREILEKWRFKWGPDKPPPSIIYWKVDIVPDNYACEIGAYISWKIKLGSKFSSLASDTKEYCRSGGAKWKDPIGGEIIRCILPDVIENKRKEAHNNADSSQKRANAAPKTTEDNEAPKNSAPDLQHYPSYSDGNSFEISPEGDETSVSSLTSVSSEDTTPSVEVTNAPRNSASNTASGDEPAPKIKRKVGRPRKVPNDSAVRSEQASKKRRFYNVDPDTATQRKPQVAPKATEENNKRGPGRPAGSKNKAKKAKTQELPKGPKKKKRRMDNGDSDTFIQRNSERDIARSDPDQIPLTYTSFGGPASYTRNKSAPKNRGPGRPLGSKNKTNRSTDATEQVPVKKKQGPGQPKRGPGRPKGSRKKVNASTRTGENLWTTDGVDGWKYSCDRPGCSYGTNHCKDDLRRHKANEHDIGVIWHHCGQVGCDYKAKEKGNLKVHKRNVHKFFCVECTEE